MNKEGSVLILVVIIYSIMILVCYQAWQNASLSYEAAALRYRQIKHEYLAESLANYGLVLIKKGLVNLKELKLDKEELVFANPWPQIDGFELYQGEIWLTKQEGLYLMLRASLLKTVILKDVIFKLKQEKSRIVLIQKN